MIDLTPDPNEPRTHEEAHADRSLSLAAYAVDRMADTTAFVEDELIPAIHARIVKYYRAHLAAARRDIERELADYAEFTPYGPDEVDLKAEACNDIIGYWPAHIEWVVSTFAQVLSDAMEESTPPLPTEEGEEA